MQKFRILAARLDDRLKCDLPYHGDIAMTAFVYISSIVMKTNRFVYFEPTANKALEIRVSNNGLDCKHYFDCY